MITKMERKLAGTFAEKNFNLTLPEFEKLLLENFEYFPNFRIAALEAWLVIQEELNAFYDEMGQSELDRMAA